MAENTITILLVEDDALLRDAFRLLLEDAGHRVLQAATGAEAIEQAASGGVQLVLLDLGLPDRPGLDVARELRAAHGPGGLRIVALTGRTGAAEQRACMQAGCDHYLAKPIEPNELLRRIPDLMA